MMYTTPEIISCDEHNQVYLKRGNPRLIKGLSDKWPARHKWSLSYFAETFSTAVCGYLPLKGNVHDLNGDRGSRLEYKSVQEAIHLIEENDPDRGLSIATPLEVFGQGLDADFEIPDHCKQKSFLRSRLFISPTGAVTTIHQDMFENFYVVLKGAKKVILFPPDAEVYANSRFSKLPNHAQVDPEHPDYERFPKFKNSKGYSVTVKEGETLYIPSLWWHYMRTETTTIALSIWWTEGWMTPIARFAAWYKKFRNI